MLSALIWIPLFFRRSVRRIANRNPFETCLFQNPSLPCHGINLEKRLSPIQRLFEKHETALLLLFERSLRSRHLHLVRFCIALFSR